MKKEENEESFADSRLSQYDWEKEEEATNFPTMKGQAFLKH